MSGAGPARWLPLACPSGGAVGGCALHHRGGLVRKFAPLPAAGEAVGNWHLLSDRPHRRARRRLRHFEWCAAEKLESERHVGRPANTMRNKRRARCGPVVAMHAAMAARLAAIAREVDQQPRREDDDAHIWCAAAAQPAAQRAVAPSVPAGPTAVSHAQSVAKEDVVEQAHVEVARLREAQKGSASACSLQAQWRAATAAAACTIVRCSIESRVDG